MTEGPCRMRKKMVKNHQFYIHYPYRPELESGDNVNLKFLIYLHIILLISITSYFRKD